MDYAVEYIHIIDRHKNTLVNDIIICRVIIDIIIIYFLFPLYSVVPKYYYYEY